jgi:TP901 family phage tail tape measure protein
LDGSNVAKTIAELRVEIKNAIDPLEELRKKFVSVDDAIKKTQTNLSQFSQSFSNVGTSAKGMASQVGGAIQDIEKVSAATINKLAQIERTLVSTMAKARSMGVEVPGAKQELDVVRQLQDQLRIGEQISKETSKQIQNASNYATLQSRRVATLEKEVTLNKEAAAQEQLKNQSQQRSALAASQAAQQQRTSQEKVAQTIMQENALHQQTVFALEAKAASTLKQLTFNKMADGSIGQQLVALRGQLQQYQSLLTSGQVLSKVEVERLQQLQMQLEILQSQAKTKMADTGVESFSDAIKKNSVLASQWERKISWFLSGTAFYGGIRAIQGVSRALSQLESDMTVIARTTDDATFNFNKMRDELIEVGKDFGRGWESVSQVATEWTKAGYNVADTLELTRTSLLALNVADMTVQQATSGLIAIMSQWDLQAQDLELVIDKLNITSDRYAITTGDLVEAVLRSSGAARAANIEFDELVGMITATRVASGRAGAEIGNAMNTILSYITRQSTLNKLAQAGIATFADEARTKLRPAVDIMGDIVEKWQDNAEAMPEALIEMADSMGMFSEEMAEMVDLQGEWTDLQKIEVEQATAGVRRRQFLIALMRNFSQVQDVVNNLSEAEGYSMVQNVQTMKTLERQYEQLKLEMLGLTQALGDAGLMGQLKAVVSVGKDVIRFLW